MRVKKLKNISSEIIKVKHKKGRMSILPPGTEITNVTIIDEEELKGKVQIVADLTEVNEKGMKTKLYD